MQSRTACCSRRLSEYEQPTTWPARRQTEPARAAPGELGPAPSVPGSARVGAEPGRGGQPAFTRAQQISAACSAQCQPERAAQPPAAAAAPAPAPDWRRLGGQTASWRPGEWEGTAGRLGLTREVSERGVSREAPRAAAPAQPVNGRRARAVRPLSAHRDATRVQNWPIIEISTSQKTLLLIIF